MIRTVRTMVLAGSLLAAVGLPLWAEPWDHGCDAGQDLAQCVDLIDRYQQGDAPFPKDHTRASALRVAARDVAVAQCYEFDPDACQMAGGLIAADVTQPAAERLSALRDVANFVLRSCSYGDAFMCGALLDIVIQPRVLEFGADLDRISLELSEQFGWLKAGVLDYAVTSGGPFMLSMADIEEDNCQSGNTDACLTAARLHIQANHLSSQDPVMVIRLLDHCLDWSEGCDTAHRHLYALSSGRGSGAVCRVRGDRGSGRDGRGAPVV